MADPQVLLGLGTATSAVLLFSFGRLLHSRRLRLPPGPRPWPIVGNLPQLTREPHKALEKLSKTYGPLMFLKVGSIPTVIASSPEMAKECLQGNLFASRPTLLMGEIINFGPQSDGHQSLGQAKYGPLLTLLRKICTVELFSPKRILQFKDVRSEEVIAQVLDILEKSMEGKPILLDTMMLEISNNNITRMLFSKTAGEIKIGKDDSRAATNDIQDLIAESSAMNTEPFLGNFIPYLKWLDLEGLKPRMWKVRQRWIEFLGAIIEEHRMKNDQGKDSSTRREDFVDVLLSLQEEEKLTDDIIKGLLKDLILAGSDAPAKQATWTIAQLVSHPDVQKKLQLELDSVVSRDRLVDESDIPSLPYLQAVVKESFRLCPILPLLVPHESINLKPTKLAGYDIPPKTRMFVNVFAIQRDPSVWKDPLRFDPERFMNKCPVDIKGQNFEVLPFGSGRRICVGLHVGLQLVQLTVAQLVHAFEWTLHVSADPEVMDDMELYTGLIVAKPIPFKVSPRLPLDVYNRCKTMHGVDYNNPTAD